MEEYKWVPRSADWIKENPGKGTMYKVLKTEDVKSNYLIIRKPKKPKKEPKPQSMPVIPGIYVIICEPAKYVYVGQSINMHSRLRSHKMAILSSSKYGNNATYIKIKQHVKLHGIDNFQFIKHLQLPDVDTLCLLEHEQRTMFEFLDKGYKLYNTEIPAGNNMIYCPGDIKDLIHSIISLAKVDANFIDKLKALID